MWLVSTSLIAMQKSSHDLCVSLTFWCMMSGNSSCTFQIKFDPAFIFTCRARLQAFSVNVTCDQTSSPTYFTFFPNSSTIMSLSSHNSLSNSNSDFFAF